MRSKIYQCSTYYVIPLWFVCIARQCIIFDHCQTILRCALGRVCLPTLHSPSYRRALYYDGLTLLVWSSIAICSFCARRIIDPRELQRFASLNVGSLAPTLTKISLVHHNSKSSIVRVHFGPWPRTRRISYSQIPARTHRSRDRRTVSNAVTAYRRERSHRPLLQAVERRTIQRARQ